MMLRPRCFVLLTFLGWAACPAAPAQAQGEQVVVVGALTDEGVECPVVRGDDGTLYSITRRSALAGLQPGDRVRLEGELQKFSICQQGQAIAITSVERAE
jgi:hypothetical protein